MKKSRFSFFILSLLIAIAMASSCSEKIRQPLHIAVSKAAPNYINWLKKADSTIIPVDMYAIKSLDSALAELANCSGLLVTGGEDINPSLYRQPSEAGKCVNIDGRRDTLEQALIRKALELKIPVLGICRGEQIINVTLGGTLMTDIPTRMSNDPVIHQCKDYLKCYHSVKVIPNSLLRSVIACDSGFVTSNHHQAIDMLAPGLKVNVQANDGLPEGIEWIDPSGKSFLLAVQWHPERMDISNSFSGNILREFIEQSVRYYQEHKSGKP